MPRRPKKPCAYPGCPKLTDGRYCEEHRKSEEQKYNRYQRAPDINKKYGRAWKRIRDAYVTRHPLCEDCLEQGKYVPAVEVHHIKPVSQGGTSTFDNLRALCRSCHQKRHLAIGDRHVSE